MVPARVRNQCAVEIYGDCNCSCARVRMEEGNRRVRAWQLVFTQQRHGTHTSLESMCVCWWNFHLFNTLWHGTIGVPSSENCFVRMTRRGAEIGYVLRRCRCGQTKNPHPSKWLTSDAFAYTLLCCTHTRRRKKTHIRFWHSSNQQQRAHGYDRVVVRPLCTVLIGSTHTDRGIEKGRTEVVCGGDIAGK